MYLVPYVADCPICGAKGRDLIHIETGRLEFFGRLVGHCNRAPNAYVFSFDYAGFCTEGEQPTMPSRLGLVVSAVHAGAIGGGPGPLRSRREPGES